jgi:DNA-binding response OmpR family regulator
MLNSTTILVVAQEKNLRSTLDQIFKQAGYSVIVAHSIPEAQTLVRDLPVSLLFLDLFFPAHETPAIVREIHIIRPELPILTLAARPAQPAALHAIHCGARDYLVKPVDPVQILDRVRSVLHEVEPECPDRSTLIKARMALPATLGRLSSPPNYTSPIDPNRFLRRGPLLLDLHARQASLASQFIPLPSRAFDTLVTLARHAPSPISVERLALETFPLSLRPAKTARLVRRQIHLLRCRLEPNPYHPKYILRVPPSGYRLSI